MWSTFICCGMATLGWRFKSIAEQGCLLQGDDAVGAGAHAPSVLLATAASLFPDPLQTANSEMLLNTADPLSSINSTITILDTFEERERQARQVGCNPSHDSMYVTLCKCLGIDYAPCVHAEVMIPVNIPAAYKVYEYLPSLSFNTRAAKIDHAHNMSLMQGSRHAAQMIARIIRSAAAARSAYDC